MQSSGGVVKLEIMNIKGEEAPWEEGEMGMSDVRKDVPPKTAFTVSAGFECLEIYYKKNVDLYLCYCGIEECSKGHSFGPAVRNEYLIHYILSGRGMYQIHGKTYEVGPGCGTGSGGCGDGTGRISKADLCGAYAPLHRETPGSEDPDLGDGKRDRT